MQEHHSPSVTITRLTETHDMREGIIFENGHAIYFNIDPNISGKKKALTQEQDDQYQLFVAQIQENSSIQGIYGLKKEPKRPHDLDIEGNVIFVDTASPNVPTPIKGLIFLGKSIRNDLVESQKLSPMSERNAIDLSNPTTF